MICLSKNLTDEYINYYARGAKLEIYDYNFDWRKTNNPILIRSLAKRKLIWECLEKQHDFYYMDSGYLGNNKSPQNPYGWKLYHRIVKNNLQHSEIIERRGDRLDKLGYKIHTRKKGGNHILLVTPSEKPCKFYKINKDQWVKETIERIKKYTDRPIIVRDKQPRHARLRDSIFKQLDNAHAMVTYQSIAAIESTLYGIPAFTLAPTAADPVANTDLSLIEKPNRFDKDYIYSWACHLAYCQYHVSELKDGTAHRMIMEDKHG